MTWNVEATGIFHKNAKKYSKDTQVRNALNSRLTLLQNREFPERLGDIKSGSLRGIYGLRLTKSIRLLYQVDYDTHTIRLINVGDHKEVYGKD